MDNFYWPIMHPREDGIAILVALAAVWSLMFEASAAAFVTFFYAVPSYRSPMLQFPLVLDVISDLGLVLSSIMLAVRNLHLPIKKIWLATVGVAFAMQFISLLIVLVLNCLEFKKFQELPTAGTRGDIDDIVNVFSAVSIGFNLVKFVPLWGFVGYCATRIYRKRWGENVLTL